jgi:hypothetical protein
MRREWVWDFAPTPWWRRKILPPRSVQRVICETLFVALWGVFACAIYGVRIVCPIRIALCGDHKKKKNARDIGGERDQAQAFFWMFFFLTAAPKAFRVAKIPPQATGTFPVAGCEDFPLISDHRP